MKQKVLNFAMVLLFLAALGYCIAYSLHFKEIAYETFDVTYTAICAWFAKPVLLFTVGFFAFRILTVHMTRTKPVPIFRVLPILGFALLAFHLILGVLWYWGNLSLPDWYFVVYNTPWLFLFPGMLLALTE